MTTVLGMLRFAPLAALATVVGLTQPASAEKIVYFHADALGSPVAATGAAGQILWREEYSPYGERLLPAAAGNDLGYAGMPDEPGLGVQCFGARWYDATLGRFLGVDPVSFREGMAASFNAYAYGNLNPFRFVDPDGRLSEDVVNAVAGFGDAVSLGLTSFARQRAHIDGGVDTASASYRVGAAAGIVHSLALGGWLGKGLAQGASRSVDAIETLQRSNWLPAAGQRPVDWASVAQWKAGIESGGVILKSEAELTQMGANIVVTSPDATGKVAIVAGQHRVAAHILATGQPPPISSLTIMEVRTSEIGTQPWVK